MTKADEIRTALALVMAEATTPLTTVQLTEKIALLGTTATATEVATIFCKDMHKKVKWFRRTAADKKVNGRDRARYAYYDPSVLSLGITKPLTAVNPEPHVVGVDLHPGGRIVAGMSDGSQIDSKDKGASWLSSSATLGLNPVIEAIPEPAPTPAADTAKARTITVTLAGVTVRIELSC